MNETYVTIRGRLTADPTVRTTRIGAPMTTFRIAHSARRQVQGQPGQSVPAMDDDWVRRISERYIELFGVVTGSDFERADYAGALPRIRASIFQNI